MLHVGPNSQSFIIERNTEEQMQKKCAASDQKGRIWSFQFITNCY